MIKYILVGSQRFEYPDFLFEYLQPYFDKFGKITLVKDSDELKVPYELLDDMIELIKESLRWLIEEKYQKPTNKQRSKNPSRYRKMEFDGVLYVVDYRMDITGKIMYALNYLLSWLENNK